MSKQNNLTDFLTDVADAIREKKGTTEKINPQDFSEEIKGIESGGGNAEIEYADETIFGKDSYKNIKINEGVTSIGNYSFYYAPNIENVTLPSTMESIGEYCFAYSSITNINLSDNIKSIGAYAFSRCSKLREYIHPRGIDTVPERVCEYCNGLEYVYFPSSVRSVRSYAFFGDAKSGSVFVAEDVESWLNITFDGPDAHKPYPNTVCSSAFFVNKDYIVDEIVINNITELRTYCFAKFKNIKNVTFPENFNSIRAEAFLSSSVEKVYLGGCKTLSSRAFYGCGSLAYIDISNVEVLENRVFYGCVNLSSPLRVNPAVTTIYVYTFSNTGKVPYIDFTRHSFVPILENVSAFQVTSYKIVVPDALYDEWIAATNWSSLASRIVKASEFVEPTNE